MTDSSDGALDVDSYTRTAHAAWSSFVRGRLDAQNAAGSLGSISLRQQAVDIEIDMLAHYTAIARQHKNALSAVGRLPEELLAMIFTHAQSPSRSSGAYYPDGWIPSRRIVDVELPGGNVVAGEEKKTERVVHYQLGWIVLTHVCSAWRAMALRNQILWQSISCFALPIRAVSVVVARAGSLPLRIQAHDTFRDNIPSAALNTWPSSPLLRRAEALDMSTHDEETVHSWASLLHYAPRHLRTLSMNLDMCDIPERIPANIFASQCPPALRTLTLCNCFPEWTSPLFSANLTQLTLATPYVDSVLGSVDVFPTASDFQCMLSAMTALESLTLEEFLPFYGDNAPSVYSFHPNLKSVRVRCDSLVLLHEGVYLDFIARCRLPSPATLIVNTSPDDTEFFEEEEADELRVARFLTPVTQTQYGDDHCTVELMISYWTTGLRFNVVNIAPPWLLAQHPSERPSDASQMESVMRAGMSDECWEFVPDTWALGCIQGGRLCRNNWIKIHEYLNLFPLASIGVLSLVPNCMSHFPSPEAWSTSFNKARQVERISTSYLRSIYLLSALSRVRDEDSQPALFPNLTTIVFLGEARPSEEHLALRTALDISLVDVLVVRKEAGTPIRQIFVDQSMLKWEIWESVNDRTAVSFFQ